MKIIYVLPDGTEFFPTMNLEDYLSTDSWTRIYVKEVNEPTDIRGFDIRDMKEHFYAPA